MKALIVLMAMPIAATIITVLPATETGSRNRGMASQPMPPEAPSRKLALIKAAKIDDRRSPNVRLEVGKRRARMLAPQANSNPSTSLKENAEKFLQQF